MKQRAAAAKLGLGGHSFLDQLANDPVASFAEQCAIVEACLEHGIEVVDTTYYQERVALGRVLQQIGRRADLQIMAWNFFKQSGNENGLVPPTPFEPHHLDLILAELQTDVVDILVVHTDDDPIRLQQQLDLAARWRADGKVRLIGLGMADEEQLRNVPPTALIDRILTPYNAFNRANLGLIQLARERGLKVIALSPFIRGFKLEEIGENPADVSDILLRWVTSQDIVDQAIVSMRKATWVESNVQSVARGPLSTNEQKQLSGWIARAPGPPKRQI